MYTDWCQFRETQKYVSEYLHMCINLNFYLFLHLSRKRFIKLAVCSGWLDYSGLIDVFLYFSKFSTLTMH